MSNNDNTNIETDSKPDSKRRRLLQALGISGVTLAAAGPASAHPHGPHKNASGQSELSSEDDVPEAEGHGYGEWCQSAGFGSGMRRGHGYRRRFPHEEDDTEWDNWQPGDGRPPWAGDGDDEGDEDDDEDEDEDDEDDDTDEDESEPETYTVSVILRDAVTEEPLEGYTLTVSASPYSEDQPDDFEPVEATTNAEGVATVELQDGHYQVLTGTYEDYYDIGEHPFEVDGEDRDYLLPLVPYDVEEEEQEESEETAQEQEGPVDADTEEEQGEDEDAPTEGTEDGTTEPEEDPEPTDDETPDDEEQTVANTIEDRIHEVTNTYREAQDEDPIEFNDDLAAVARDHSEVMATEGSFSHTSPNGDGPGERLEDAGLECDSWAENIAWESGDEIHEPEDDAVSIANSVAEGWINSDGHRENILGPYDEVGVGVFIDAEAGQAFVTQLFCTPVESTADDSDGAANGAEDGSEDGESTDN